MITFGLFSLIASISSAAAPVLTSSFSISDVKAKVIPRDLTASVNKIFLCASVTFLDRKPTKISARLNCAGVCCPRRTNGSVNSSDIINNTEKRCPRFCVVLKRNITLILHYLKLLWDKAVTEFETKRVWLVTACGPFGSLIIINNIVDRNDFFPLFGG